MTLVPPLLPFLLLAVGFAPTLVWIAKGWFLDTGYYSHGPLLVLACLWFVYRARRRVAAEPRAPSRRALPVLALFLLVHLAGQALLVDSLSGAAFVPALFCLVWAVHGGRRLLVLAPALGCLLFAVPLPIFVTGKIAYEMKHIATAVGVFLGNLGGLGLTQTGANIVVPGQAQPLVVGDACSGLRSLVALVSLGYVYAFFLTPRRLWGRLCFVVLAVPIALASNFLRIAALAALAKWKGVDFASGPAHDWSGYLLYAAAIGLLLVVDFLLPGRVRAAPPPSEPAAGGPERAPVAASALVALLGLPALAAAIWQPGADDVRFADGVPERTARFELVEDHDFPERWYSLIGTRDVRWRRYRSVRTGRVVDLTAIFQGTKWKSLHPPEVCLISAGYEIASKERRSVEAGGGTVELQVLVVERGASRYLVGYGFGGADFFTPSFLGFFARSAPRALLRRDTCGFLLRVDVPWPRDRDRAVAERALAAFVADFLPEMRELIGKP